MASTTTTHRPEPPPAWTERIEATVGRLDTDADRGLSESDAARRLARHGPNELRSAPPESAWARLIRQFVDPLVLLLLAAIAISFAAWAFDGAEGVPVEAIVIVAIVGLNALIGAWQEARADRAVAALQRMTATRSTVIRDGEERQITSDRLVPGDVLALSAGDAVGADARVVTSAELQVGEAALTGESVPVSKSTAPNDPATLIAERTSMVFGGTAVTAGRGRAIVVATGMDTEFGRIATLLEETGGDETPLQREMHWLGRMLGWTVVALTAAVVGVIIAMSEIDGPGDVLDALLVGVSLAVAAVPEGLPAILTVVLALGVQRMASRDAVVKRLSSVETLGAASVICTDKTGTLTRNEMTVVSVLTPSALVELGDGAIDDRSVREEVERILLAGSLASDATVTADGDGGWSKLGDPTEIALVVALRRMRPEPPKLERIAELPFDSDRKLMSTAHLDPDATFGVAPTGAVQLTKGAPDVLLSRCALVRLGGTVVPLTPDVREDLTSAIDELADRGLRTLGVAERPLARPPHQLVGSDEHGLTLLGVVGIVDPPRREAATAIAEAQRGGVDVVMITGDHPRTAARIAAELGIGGATPSVTTGRQLREIDDDALASRVDVTDVFARVEPADKLRIVHTLQREGHVTAMTGDGVNDAPALRQADIGVAMGITGTEVAKEASDMILADDHFATILRAVREGRELFANIRKFLRYLLASNAGEVLVVVLGVVLAVPLGLEAAGVDGDLAVPLLATQILWINLLTDSALALALGVDSAVDDVMARPPRRLGERVVDGSMLATIALVGLTTALAGLIAFDLELEGGLLGGSGDLATARTMVFTTLVLAQVANAFNARSDVASAATALFRNRLLWVAAAITVAGQILVVHLPPLGAAFDTEPLSLGRWAICAGLASAVLWVEELRKLVVRRVTRRR